MASAARAHIPAALIHDFDVYNPDATQQDYFGTIRGLHEAGLPDVFWTPRNGGHWVALTGERILEVARDPANFSSSRLLVPDEANFKAGALPPLMSDPPEHTAYRAILVAIFSAPRMSALEANIRDFAAGVIDEIQSKGRCEFVDDFSLHMPIVVFMNLLNLPLDHRHALLALEDKVINPSSDEERNNVLQLVLDYLGPLVDARCEEPGEDVLSELTRVRIAGKALTRTELLGITTTLLFGGLDTVAATLCFFARYLAENPQQRCRLVAEPALASRAVEELIRRFPVTTHGCYIMNDLDFCGVPFKKHQHIMWTASMYNFDHRVFDNPMTVDFDRSRVRHISFGTGIHACLGAALSRLELRIFIEEWLKRIPEFNIEPGTALRFRPGINYGMRSLPLVWA